METQFPSPERRQPRRCVAVGPKASLGGGERAGSDNLTHFVVRSFSDLGDGTWGPSELSQWPT